MEEETNVDAETTENEAEVETEATESEEEIDWKAKAEKAEELAKNYKVRAEKAEGKAKGVHPEVKVDGLTTKDTIAIVNAKVHEDDIDEVVEYAKFKKIPVAEALKSDVIKTTLSQRTEERKTAEMSNTGSGRRSVTKPTDEDILKKANAGEIPESDEDIDRLVKAKFKTLKK